MSDGHPLPKSICYRPRSLHYALQPRYLYAPQALRGLLTYSLSLLNPFRRAHAYLKVARVRSPSTASKSRPRLERCPFVIYAPHQLTHGCKLQLPYWLLQDQLSVSMNPLYDAILLTFFELFSSPLVWTGSNGYSLKQCRRQCIPMYLMYLYDGMMLVRMRMQLHRSQRNSQREQQ
jgi:hypothetical protein